MKILVFDNYDSFTYNLVHYVEEIINESVDVYRNDKISLEDIDKYDKILLSPGPGIPEESGILLDLLKKYAETKDIFGVCLGMQAIGEVFGGKLINTQEVYHGVASDITITDRDENLFKGLDDVFDGGRYHSWIVDKDTLPECLKITAVDDDGTIMALSHKTLKVKGVQFHPESVLTKQGKQIIKNWLEE